MAKNLSMYSITENIYCSQLSSVAILLRPELVSHRKIQRKDCVLSPSVLSSCGLPLPPTCLLLTANEARSYFASAILRVKTAYIISLKFAQSVSPVITPPLPPQSKKGPWPSHKQEAP
jgi:hypothetical protein